MTVDTLLTLAALTLIPAALLIGTAISWVRAQNLIDAQEDRYAAKEDGL